LVLGRIEAEEPSMPIRTDALPPDPVIEAYKKDIDVTLIRENLKLTPEDRARKLMALQRAAEEFRRAGREARARRWTSSEA
jgi:hypothetical protein